MSFINIEIKARSTNHAHIKNILTSKNADFKGVDHQVDYYFNAQHGRLKLRLGKIENNLIFYHRENSAGPKQSTIALYQSDPKSTLKSVLKNALGVKVVVDKQRAIYFLENVKFHLDEVNGLGTFIEIEAIDRAGNIGVEKLREQIDFYMKLFDVSEEDLISVSYSDLILEKNQKK